MPLPQRLVADYRAMAFAATAVVLERYSTSFALGTRLLARPVREDIRALYAVVRIADELVDGTAVAAGVDPAELPALLDSYEQAVYAAVDHPLSTDPVLHAFGDMARRCHLQREHIAAFFASMRADLDPQPLDEAGFRSYIYGSAEVIGLMCVAIFVHADPPPPAVRAQLDAGAQHFGAALQTLNFLRDLQADTVLLGRSYFPHLRDRAFDEEVKHAILDAAEADLHAAAAALPLLPRSARWGVAAAWNLFAALALQLRRTAAAEILHSRVRLSPAQKARILARPPGTLIDLTSPR